MEKGTAGPVASDLKKQLRFPSMTHARPKGIGHTSRILAQATVEMMTVWSPDLRGTLVRK